MKKTLIIICCGLLIAGGLYFFRRPVAVHTKPIESNAQQVFSYATKEIKLGTTLFTLEIADTPALQERGLSYRESLASSTGMLFIFDTPALYHFWMKDMNFPIDIIWLNQNKKVVHIEHSISPSTYPQSFGPQTSTQYVIEIPAGRAKEIGISKGDQVSL
jgi:uncharacterized membrane protein (UPF0127 family)